MSGHGAPGSGSRPPPPPPSTQPPPHQPRRKPSDSASASKSRRGQASKRGWLEKEAFVVKDWRRRWFVLKGKFLFYTKSDQDDLRTPKGVINLQDCRIVADDYDRGKRAHKFSVHHETRRTIHFNAYSESDRLEWVEALQAAAKDKQDKVLIEYRGRFISDPEDAKQIALAHADVQNFVYEQYHTAYCQLKTGLKQEYHDRNKLETLKAQKKLLIKEVKTLRQDVATSEETYNRVEEEISSLRDSNLVTLSQERRLVERVGKLLDYLESSELESIAADANYTNADQTELLRLSQSRLANFEVDLGESGSGVHHDLYTRYKELLQTNLDLRLKKNNYAEHILVLTQEKLQRFDRQFDEKLSRPAGKSRKKKKKSYLNTWRG